MRRYFAVIVLLALIPGCVKEITWTPAGNAPLSLVVDAVITDEVKSHQVMLTFPVSQLNQAPEPFTGASVLIIDEDSTWQLTEDLSRTGCYKTQPWFSARLQKNYTLIISRDNRVYTAKTNLLPGKLFQELRYLKNEGMNMYYIDWVANAFSTSDAAMWELLIDWSMVPGYQELDSLDNHARLLFYTLPTLDVSEIFAPMMETTLFPAGTIINERRYSLTPSHAAFIREMLLETNWTGGMFPVAAANVGTNLSNGAIGYFGACSVTELSVIVAPAADKVNLKIQGISK
jgi:hypothetical protein